MQVVWFWISRGQKSWCLWNSKSFPSRKFNFNRKFITSKLELFGIDWWIKHLPSFFFLLLLFPIDGQMSWQARSLWQFHTYFYCELITLFIYNTYSQKGGSATHVNYPSIKDRLTFFNVYMFETNRASLLPVQSNRSLAQMIDHQNLFW